MSAHGSIRRMRSLVFAAAVASAGTARAAPPLVVNGTADRTAMDRQCSLREAVAAINTGVTVNECTVNPLVGVPNEITFGFGALTTISLTSPLEIQASMTINGGTSSLVILDGRGLNGLITVHPAVTLHLTGVTLQNSHVDASGGNRAAVSNAGAVYLDRVTCLDSFRAGGGACLLNVAAAGNSAIAVVTNSQFARSNAAASAATAVGGAIFNTGTLTITGSTFFQNAALEGGAIATGLPSARTTQTDLTSCTFVGNTAAGAGGAVSVADGQPLNVSLTVFRANSSNGGAGGGAVAARGTIRVADSQFTGNSTATHGGGILAGPAQRVSQRLELRRTTLAYNVALGHGGGVFAGGGETVVASNLTLADNTAHGNGGGLAGQGSNTFRISSATITGNQANALWNNLGTGGGVYHESGLFTLQNSALAGNTDNAAGATAPDCYAVGGAAAGGLYSGGYNVFGSLSGCATSGAVSTDRVDALPFFDQLTAAGPAALGTGDGESLLVMTVHPGSPLINAGNPAGCAESDGSLAPPWLTTDALGAPRSVLRCDVGAWESSCGNGAAESAEACDDANAVNADGCLTSCVFNTCGDGFRNPAAEQCDDGSANGDTAHCLGSCMLAICSDGFVYAGVETCDDSNRLDGDGCDHTCHVEGAAGGSSGPPGSSGGVQSSSSGTAPSSGAGGSSSQGVVCLAWQECTPPTEAQCNGAAYGDSCCGKYALQAGRCDSVCAAATGSITRDQCEGTWLSSVCGQREMARWETAVNQGNLALSTCAQLKTVLTEDGGVDMRDPPDGGMTRILLPRQLITGEGELVDAGPRTPEMARTFPYRPSGMFHSGDTSTFRGWRTHQAIREASANPQYDLMDNFMDMLVKQSWNANGKRVDSCREYVYEKYWNFSRWEDETQGAGNNFRKYVEVAYAEPRASRVQGVLAPVIPFSAIGTLGVQGLPIRSRDGKALAKQVEFEQDNTAKNIFFTVGPWDPDSGDPNSFGQVLHAVLGGRVATLPLCGGSWVWTNLMVCDDTLSQILYDGVENHRVANRGWAYHKQKWEEAQAAGYSDDDFYAADGLKDRYARLLRRRGKLIAEIWAILSAPAHKEYLPAGTKLPDALWSPDPAWSQIETMRGRMAAGGIMTNQITPISAADVGAVAKLDYANAVPGFTMGMTANLTGFMSAVQQSVQSSTQGAPGYTAMSHRSGGGGGPGWAGYLAAGDVLHPVLATQTAFQDKLLSMSSALLEVDGLLELALQEARDLSCLELNGPNPCDWSPRDFAQAVVGYYTPDQEADYQRCTKNTAGGFKTKGGVVGRKLAVGNGKDQVYPTIKGVLNGHIAVYPCALDVNGNLQSVGDGTSLSCSGPYCDGPSPAVNALPFSCPKDTAPGNHCNQWNKDTTHLDTYFQCLDSFKGLIARMLEDMGDMQDENGKFRPSQSTGDTQRAGNGDFNLHYSYGFGWAVGNFDAYQAGPNQGKTCVLQPEMYAHFSAGATAFKHSVELVEGSGHVQTGAASAFDLQKLDVDAERLSFKVLGMDLLSVPTNVDAGGTHVSVDIAHGDVPKERDFIRVTVPFSLGPIPMSLTGGVAGRLGVKYGAQLQLGGPEPCNNGVSAYFTPYAGVDGFAELGIDILVASAGVKITLTIIQAELPFTVSVGLAGGMEDLSINFETNMDLVLSTLGGRISVYLRILFASWDWTVFSWEGFRKVMNIFHADMHIPMFGLNALLGL